MWQDFSFLADSLSRLQEVSAQLAAASGNRGHNISHALYRLEIHVND
jgi:hypothetical protein